jgi:hypothetical protein
MNPVALLSFRAQADPAAAATVGKLVLSFSGDVLNLIMRMERSQRRSSTGLVLERAKSISESGLDLETATGFWNMVSIRVRVNNFFAHTLPPWPDAIQPTPTSPRTKEDQRIPSRPIASSTRVTIQSGEALTDAEPIAIPGSPARAGMSPHHLSPGLDRFVPITNSYLYFHLGNSWLSLKGFICSRQNIFINSQICIRLLAGQSTLCHQRCIENCCGRGAIIPMDLENFPIVCTRRSGE